GLGRHRNLPVGEAETLGLTVVGKAGLGLHNLLDLPKEPGIDLGQAENALQVPSLGEGLADPEKAFRIGHAELGLQLLVVVDALVGSIADEAEALDLQAAQGL